MKERTESKKIAKTYLEIRGETLVNESELLTASQISSPRKPKTFYLIIVSFIMYKIFFANHKKIDKRNFLKWMNDLMACRAKYIEVIKMLLATRDAFI